jgi:hypothetical protein
VETRFVEEKRGETGPVVLVWIIMLLLVVLVNIKCFGEVKTCKGGLFFLESSSAAAGGPADDDDGLFLLIRPNASTD